MEFDNLSDIELLGLIEKKDKNSNDAFRFVYRKYSQQVMTYCRNMLKNNTSAEDVFQETFIKFFRNAGTRKNHVSIIGFLLTISRNLCYDYFKTKKNVLSFEECGFNIFDTIPDEKTNDEVEKKYLLMIESMELLSSDDKELLVLRIYNKLSYYEIAALLNTNESNARKKVFRAKMKLKRIIEPYYPLVNY